MPEWKPAFDELATKIAGTPIMTVDQGQRIWAHFVEHRPVDVLDIGTCYGASAAYLAGALRHLGRGRVVTVDSNQFDDVSPAREQVAELLERCALTDWVDTVRMPHSSYAWWLLEEVERCTSAGRCTPAYDFIYLDGAKTLTIDTTSVVLAERLLRPGGWLLLDDLDWSFERRPELRPTTVLGNGTRYELSDAEIRVPHIAAVFEHVLRPHPAFGSFRIDADGEWGWAQKTTATTRELVVRTEVTDEVSGRALLRAAAAKAIDRGRRAISR
jgi:predicted O-methyltransferase YrrM